MKVLHISTMDKAGAGLCCIRIHQTLLSQGIESKVLVMKKTTNSPEVYEYGFYKVKLWRLPSKLLRIMGLKLTDWNMIQFLRAKYHTTYTLPISPVDVTKHELCQWADIIHLHWVNNYVDLPSFFRKIEKPVVWTLHDENFFYGIAHHHKNILADNPLEIKYRGVRREAVQSANNLTIVFLSQMMYENFGKEKFIEGRRKTVINNSVNSQVFKPQNRQEMRKKYGLDMNKLYFVFISMNIADPNKGLDMLSEVLQDICPDAEVLAIGDNPWHYTWDNVKPMGLVSSQEQMCELISCANYFAMPSYQEAFSQSPLEAMACGLPVVVFPVSGTQELVNDKNGVICCDFTKEALKLGIGTLMSRTYDSIEIRQDMIEHFSPAVIANKYIDLYNNIVNE